MRTYSFAHFAALAALAALASSVWLGALGACSRTNIDGTQRRSPIPLLEPPPRGEGVQYRMETTVEPGTESYGCMLFTAPPEGLYINREEVGFSEGGHHVLLYRTPYHSIPTSDENNVRVNAGAVHDCSRGATSRWKVSGVLGGSESFGGEGMVSKLPPGVAIIVPPGTVLLMSTHYLNASPDPLTVDARINLYTIPKEDAAIEAGVLYMDNPLIHVPAKGSGSAHMRCPIPRDISIVSLQSHMHMRGRSFAADAARGSATKLLYETRSWSDPEVRSFDPPLRIHGGASIDVRCEYMNTGPRDVERGLSASDEMCQLIGPYFPRDPQMEACLDDSDESAALWIGEGEASCAETWACLTGAGAGAPGPERGLAACVMASCPEVAQEVSDLARCRLSRGGGECDAACASPSGPCQECLLVACSAALDACASATCGRAPTHAP